MSAKRAKVTKEGSIALTSSLPHLPDDLWLMVLHWASLRAIGNCTKVCRSFRKLVETHAIRLYSTVCVRYNLLTVGVKASAAAQKKFVSRFMSPGRGILKMYGGEDEPWMKQLPGWELLQPPQVGEEESSEVSSLLSKRSHDEFAAGEEGDIKFLDDRKDRREAIAFAYRELVLSLKNRLCQLCLGISTQQVHYPLYNINLCKTCRLHDPWAWITTTEARTYFKPKSADDKKLFEALTAEEIWAAKLPSQEVTYGSTRGYMYRFRDIEKLARAKVASEHEALVDDMVALAIEKKKIEIGGSGELHEI